MMPGKALGGGEQKLTQNPVPQISKDPDFMREFSSLASLSVPKASARLALVPSNDDFMSSVPLSILHKERVFSSKNHPQLCSALPLQAVSFQVLEVHSKP
jgi:hypothetical protein